MKTEKKINANYHLTEHFNLKFKHFVSTGLNVIKERIVSTHQFFKSQNCPYICTEMSHHPGGLGKSRPN